MLRNTYQTYGLVAQLLHWATAILILTLLALGLYMERLPDNSAELVAHKSWFYSLHKTIGVTAFLVACARILWALSQKQPFALNAERKLEHFAAHLVHWLLYGSMIVMPISGWLHHAALDGFAPIWGPFPQGLPIIPKDPHVAELFGTVHGLAAKLLIGSLVLHIAGAAKHVVIDRDQTLARMVPGMKVKIDEALADMGHKWLPVALSGVAFAAIIGFAIGGNMIGQSGSAAKLEATETAASQVQAWTVRDLGISVIQSGQPVAGRFTGWDAAIHFDPDNLAASNVKVLVQIDTLELGGVSARAISPDFLNAALYPTALFEARDFEKVGENSFKALGTLTLAGQSKPFEVSFQLGSEDDRQVIDGQATIPRLDFGIGAEGFPGDSTVGFDVGVTFKLDIDD